MRLQKLSDCQYKTKNIETQQYNNGGLLQKLFTGPKPVPIRQEDALPYIILCAIA